MLQVFIVPLGILGAYTLVFHSEISVYVGEDPPTVAACHAMSFARAEKRMG